jgi:hypothetical protein
MLRPLEPAEIAANWAAARRYLRRYFLALMLPALALIWASGYGKGLLDGWAAAMREARPETVSKESKNASI